MSNVIEFPVIPRKPADRGGQIYRCSDCGEEAQITVMFVLPAVHCDGCGAEMRLVEPKTEVR